MILSPAKLSVALWAEKKKKYKENISATQYLHAGLAYIAVLKKKTCKCVALQKEQKEFINASK